MPAGIRAGDYSAPVTVHTGAGDITCELALRVWDFDLPVKQSLRTSTTIYGAWGWTDEIKGWFGDPEYWPFLREQQPVFMEYLARCRLSPSGIGNLPMKWDEDKGEVVIGDTADFEKYAQMYLDMGHHMDHMPVPFFYDRAGFLGAEGGGEAFSIEGPQNPGARRVATAPPERFLRALIVGLRRWSPSPFVIRGRPTIQETLLVHGRDPCRLLTLPFESADHIRP